MKICGLQKAAFSMIYKQELLQTRLFFVIRRKQPHSRRLGDGQREAYRLRLASYTRAFHYGAHDSIPVCG